VGEREVCVSAEVVSGGFRFSFSQCGASFFVSIFSQSLLCHSCALFP
jgi:hypothetical protein